MSTLLLIHIAVTCFMTGISWVMSLIHYPAYYLIRPEAFIRFQKTHIRNTSYVTFPGLMLETITGGWLLYQLDFTEMTWLHYSIPLLLFQFIITFGWFVPLHFQLAKGFDNRKADRLNQVHWLRTISWSSRSAFLLLYCLSISP